MQAWICETCGVQHAVSDEPPQTCVICEDERQYVGPGGQRWTTGARLAQDHVVTIREEEPDLWGVGVDPQVGIGQRALLVRTPAGNVLWDCVPLLTDDARTQLAGLGGISAICVSHPHFYGANVEFADAFDARVLVPAADREWVRRPSDRIELFDEEVTVLPGVTLARIGGHFDGASVLHWAAGAEGRGALLTGDTVQVVPDTGWVSFMWSYPNLIPLDERTVQEIADRVSRFPFARVYGGWWGRVVLHDGASAVRRSAERYVDRLRGLRPPAA